MGRLSFVPALGNSIRLFGMSRERTWSRLERRCSWFRWRQSRFTKWSPCTERVHFTIVGDPLGRLQRLYGNPTLLSSGRARTFLVDPDGWLRFHVVHSLSERGMGVIRELLQACQGAEIAVLV